MIIYLVFQSYPIFFLLRSQYNDPNINGIFIQSKKKGKLILKADKFSKYKIF